MRNIDLLTSENILSEYQTDFGNLFIRKPSVVARPQSLSSLQACLEYARALGLSVAVRGGGQSFSGQSICENGMVLDMSALSSEQFSTQIGDGWIRSAAGSKLYDLQHILRQQNIRLPVYTSATKASLGGTLAAGGISGRSFSKGMLASHVQELHLMGTDGKIWRCSRNENRDIFSTSLATMGLNGVLLAAKLMTEPLLPYRVQLVIKKMPVKMLVPLCNIIKLYPEIVSMEGFINPVAGHITVDVYCTIEAQEEKDVNGKISVLNNIINEIIFAGCSIRVMHINDPLSFSESLAGWAQTGKHNIQTNLINKRHTVYAIPVPTAFSQQDAVKFLSAYSDYVSEHRYYFMTRPYFAVINASKNDPVHWLRLSDHESHVIAFDLFVTFPSLKKTRGVEVLNSVSSMAAEFRGRLYPYGYIPEKNILQRLIPSLTEEMKSSLLKTDPGGFINPVLYQ